MNTIQENGGALGLAVLVSVATARTLEAVNVSAADALTSGFSWVFLRAAAFALIATGIVAIGAKDARSENNDSPGPHNHQGSRSAERHRP